MNTKLTLRLDEDVIQSAKAYSREVGKSVSKLVEDYFVALASAPEPEAEMTPRVRSLRGALAHSEVDEEDYRRYLEEKHL